MSIPFSRDSYSRAFSRKKKKALQLAHDIRKFEIELYWKRGTYFWALIAATFAGYFAVVKEGTFASILVITSVGFIFSIAWYFVNRGSAYWQKNWEAHVDCLEDDVTGPLHKTIVDPKTYKLLDFTRPYRFSPSKINTILALGVSGIWPFLMFLALNKEFDLGVGSTTIAVCVAVFIVFMVGTLAHESKSKGASNALKFVKRDTSIQE